MKIGAKLNQIIGLNASHALYRSDGKWYHHLEIFPGVLFDGNGYVVFRTRKEYKGHKQLQHKKALHVKNGIASMKGYVLFSKKQKLAIEKHLRQSTTKRIPQQLMAATVDVARQAHEGKLKPEAAIKKMVARGMNENTVRDTIRNFHHMRHGEAFARTDNEYATRLMLDTIYDRYGAEALNQALQALMGHITYYESLGKSKRPLLKRIHNEYAGIVKSNAIRLYPDEVGIDINKKYPEGTIKKVTVNQYERSKSARDACLAHYGRKCSVCGLKFEELYGERGLGFIHVHHMVELSKIKTKYQVHPINDLRPVCPNCHAMLHQEPSISIEDLRKIVKVYRSKK